MRESLALESARLNLEYKPSCLLSVVLDKFLRAGQLSFLACKIGMTVPTS